MIFRGTITAAQRFNDKWRNKMKNTFNLIVTFIALLTACASSGPPTVMEPYGPVSGPQKNHQ